MELPTQFITIESVGTVLGMATAVFMVLMVGHIFGAERELLMALGLWASILLNVMVAVAGREILILNLVISFFNSSLTFLVAWAAFTKTAPLWDKLQ